MIAIWFLLGVIAYMIWMTTKERKDKEEIRLLIAQNKAKWEEEDRKQALCDHANLYNEQNQFKHLTCPDCNIAPWKLVPSKACLKPGRCQEGQAVATRCKKINGMWCV